MKKLFSACLIICLMGITSQAQRVNQPLGFSAKAAPYYLDAVDANTAWTVGTGVVGAYVPPQVARTVNAGQTWTVANLPVEPNRDEEFTALAATRFTAPPMAALPGRSCRMRGRCMAWG